MNYGWEIAKMAFYLLVVLGVIYLLYYLLRRGTFKQQKGRFIKIRDRIHLDHNHSLLLVEVKEEIILLSSSEKGMTNLKEWSKDEFGQLPVEEKGSFKKHFNSLIGKQEQQEDE